MSPESYLGKDLDLHMQLALNTGVILNKRIKNPHLRADMINFIAMLIPQSFINRNKPDKPHHQREDNLYKDVFF